MSNDNAQKARHITITRGMRGWFAVMVWWNPDHNGFWEPWQSSAGSYDTPEEATVAGRAWAEAEGLEFR